MSVGSITMEHVGFATTMAREVIFPTDARTYPVEEPQQQKIEHAMSVRKLDTSRRIV